jgi:hypothetical protein
MSTLLRVKGQKEDTIAQWLREAAQHAEAVEEVLMSEFRVQRGQFDALWVYVGNKGAKKLSRNGESRQLWRLKMFDMDSRLRVTHRIAKNGTLSSIEVFQSLKRRRHPEGPPPTKSDSWGGIDEAMIEVYGLVVIRQ